MKLHHKPEIAENRAKWLAQLRDPASKRFGGRLESFDDPNARCCLGHACFAIEIERFVSESQQVVRYGKEGEIYQYELPPVAAAALDITTEGDFQHAVTVGDTRYTNLIDLNDHAFLKPHEIAKVIEDQFLCDNLRPAKASWYVDK